MPLCPTTALLPQYGSAARERVGEAGETAWRELEGAVNDAAAHAEYVGEQARRFAEAAKAAAASGGRGSGNRAVTPPDAAAYHTGGGGRQLQ